MSPEKLFYQEREVAHLVNEEDGVEVCDAEILDELTTSRGEFKVRTVSFSEDRRGQVNYLSFFTSFSNTTQNDSSNESHINCFSTFLYLLQIYPEGTVQSE